MGIKLVIADVDGTLLTPDKQLTSATVAAVHRLHQAGVAFTLASGRPPLGLASLIRTLRPSAPVAAFNGGLVVDEHLQPLRQSAIPPEVVGGIVASLTGNQMAVWVYQGSDWLVSEPDGPHVARERASVGFDPVVVPDLPAHAGAEPVNIVKVVGVTDDPDRMARAEAALREQFASRVCAGRSQPYYLDVTSPDANKGAAATYLSQLADLAAAEVATIGDMPVDALMFAHSGTSIAMGQADPHVQRAARYVTRANSDDGFAHAMAEFVLGGAGAPAPPAPQPSHGTA